MKFISEIYRLKWQTVRCYKMNIHVYQIIKIPDLVFLIPCYPPKVKYVCFIGSFSSAKPKGRANGPYEVKAGEGSRCGC